MQIFFKTAVLENFAISTGKHLCWSLFLIKLLVFSYPYCKVFKNTFFWRTLTVAGSEQTKNHFFALDQKRAIKSKAILKTTQIEMQKQSPWHFPVKNGVHRKALCARVSVLIKLHLSSLQFIKREIPAQYFFVGICNFFIEHLFCGSCVISCF